MRELATGSPTRRALRSPAVGHLAVALATVPVTLLLRTEIGDEPPNGSWFVDPVTAGLLLVAGQILSCGRSRRDVARVARALRRSGWSVTLAVCATVVVLRFLLTAPVPPWLSALFLMLVIASLLLEYRYVAWAHHRLNDHDEEDAVHRRLPPRVGRRLRRGQSVAVTSHAIYTGIAAMLLVATVATEAGGGAGAPLTTVVQVAAAAAVVVVPPLHIRALLLVRAAVAGDAVHLPTLRRAGGSFIRAARVAAPLAAFVVAAVPAAPAEPAVAVGRAALLAFVIGVAALQFASVGGTRTGEFPGRRLRAAGARRRLPEGGGARPAPKRQDGGMAQVTARTERTIDAPAERVRAALSDYEKVRPAILTEHYRDYHVESGGHGEGSRVHWLLQATSKRVRDQLVEVSTPGDDRIVERDANSSMVTTWTVTPAGSDRSVVAVESSWKGASGIGGFFERTFAPKGLQRIHDGVLANLENSLRG